MAVNNLRRTLNLVRDLNANGDVVDASLSDSPDTLPSLTFPSITSVHPTANLSSGDLVFLVGSNFGKYANVTLISNTGVETVAGNVTFNSTSNVTFTWPLGGGSADLNPYDLRLKIRSTGLSNASFNSANGSILTVSGYTSGGFNPAQSPNRLNVIDKFPFAADGNATDVGDLTVARAQAEGQSSTVSGYNSGGVLSPNRLNVIDKFPFAADANATDVGDLTVARSGPAGQSSSVSGYNSGGFLPVVTNVIDKFPFASDGNATDVGDLTVARNIAAGQSSDVSGYSSGGANTPVGDVNTIDKFPFASDANATDVGDLTVARGGVAGQSSTTSGYSSGGYGPSYSNVIDKFPFSSDANAADVGDLTVANYDPAGQQG